MHPTLFQLRAFGELRLPPAEATEVLHHLYTGCGRCRAELAPWLLPWLDEAPAAEARAGDPAHCGATLAGEYERAARRAARAAVRRRTEESATAADRDMQRVLALLDREGPAAIGRLPRRLLGRPAVAALLRQIELHGIDHPRLRLAWAEIAWDLASHLPGSQRQPPPLAVAAGIELANAYCARGRLAPARAWLDRMAEQLAAGMYPPLIVARCEEIMGLLHLAGCRHGASCRAAGRAMAIHRRQADARGLARSLNTLGIGRASTGGFARADEIFADALRLCAAEPPSLISWSAGINRVRALLGSGAVARALELYRLVSDVPPQLRRGHPLVGFHRLEGRIRERQGQPAAALAAYAACRRQCAALDKRHAEVQALIDIAACLERQGEAARARPVVREAADILLAGNPHRELQAAGILLATRSRFTSMRELLPLGRVAHFLDHAEFNEEARLHPFLD